MKKQLKKTNRLLEKLIIMTNRTNRTLTAVNIINILTILVLIYLIIFGGK